MTVRMKEKGEVDEERLDRGRERGAAVPKQQLKREQQLFHKVNKRKEVR